MDSRATFGEDSLINGNVVSRHTSHQTIAFMYAGTSHLTIAYIYDLRPLDSKLNLYEFRCSDRMKQLIHHSLDDIKIYSRRIRVVGTDSGL